MGTDIESEVGPGVPAIKIDDADGDFYFAKRKETGTWVNTGHFLQIWRAIKDMGEAACARQWYLSGELPLCAVRVVWQPRGLLPGGVPDAPGQHGVLQGVAAV